MPIVLIICVLLLFLKGKSTDPPKQFSTDTSDPDTITVSTANLGGATPKPVVNADGTVTITATITKAKAKKIASQLVLEFSELITEAQDVANIILQCKNDADYALVYAAFGKHGIEAFTKRLADNWISSGAYDLTEFINWQLEDLPSEKVHLHKRFPTIF